MNNYAIPTFREAAGGNEYVGRGIVIGRTANGRKAVCAYFIMGRSVNSRNRVFVENGDELIIHPFDPAKLEDPSLVIYSPIRKRDNRLIVTNGDQTDTIYDYLAAGKRFEDALDTREFEPDAPNFTPRISGMLSFEPNGFTYKLNILKSADAEGSACLRQTFCYPAISGLGHFLHTYACNGNPIPSFQGEPERVAVPDDIDEFTDMLWESLNADNRVSLYVRQIDLATGATDSRLINRHGKEA